MSEESDEKATEKRRYKPRKYKAQASWRLVADNALERLMIRAMECNRRQLPMLYTGTSDVMEVVETTLRATAFLETYQTLLMEMRAVAMDDQSSPMVRIAMNKLLNVAKLEMEKAVSRRDARRDRVARAVNQIMDQIQRREETYGDSPTGRRRDGDVAQVGKEPDRGGEDAGQPAGVGGEVDADGGNKPEAATVRVPVAAVRGGAGADGGGTV